MQHIEEIALSKAVKTAVATRARSELEPGVYGVNFKCQVSGTLTIGEDEEYTPTVAIPLKTTLALFIRRMGITREHAIEALKSAMTDALRANDDLEGKNDRILAELSESEEIVDETMNMVNEMIGELPTKVRKGKVLSDLTVSDVE